MEEYKILKELIFNEKNKRSLPLETFNPNYYTVEDALSGVAFHCDGAYEKDDIGFNASDATKGHECDALYRANLGWSESQREFAKKCMFTYRKQIVDNLNTLGKDGNKIINILQQKNPFRYKPIFVENDVFPYVSYQPKLSKFKISIPAAREANINDKKQFKKEFMSFLYNNRRNPFYGKNKKVDDQKKEIDKWIDKAWEKGNDLLMPFKKDDLSFINNLKDIGFLIDSRIYTVLKSKYTKFLKINLNKTPYEKVKYQNMKDYLMISIKSLMYDDNYRINELENRDYYLKPNNENQDNIYSLPIGSVNFEDIFNFCEKHNIKNRGILIDVLMNEEAWDKQKNILKNEDLTLELREKYGNQNIFKIS